MNNKQTIIISVTGIFLVLLILIGLTYAYFLTKINGNTNTKSISVKTANLALVYGDGNGVLEVGEVITPGNSIKFKTSSGDTVDKKTFTVTNEGNATTDYVVVIEDVKVTNVSTGAITTFESNDFRYTLTCTTDGDIACSGVEKEVFPMSGGIVVGNNLEVGKTHTYTLTMEYLETNKDQSNDMNKSFTAKLNIKDISTINPYSKNTDSLAYNIINNSIVGTNGTTLKSVPDSNVAEEVSTSTEKVLSVTQDDLGTSYYYRGNVTDNYVNFAGMCWKVVRIAGDGSTKLILEDKNTTCESSTYTGNWSIGSGNYGYDSTSTNAEGETIYKMNYLNPVTENTSSMVKAFYDFQTTSLSSYTDKLKAGDWCLGDTAYTRTRSSESDYTYTLLSDISSNYLSQPEFYYDAYTRLSGDNKDGYNPTLKCNGTKLDKFATVEGVSSEAPMYVSAITADEVAFAGGAYSSGNNLNYYLINEYFKIDPSGFNPTNFWTLSPSWFFGDRDDPFSVDVYGYLDDCVFVYADGNDFRPAISLASGAKITSGDGTQNNPYVIG